VVILGLNAQSSMTIPGYHTATDSFTHQLPRDLGIRQGQASVGLELLDGADGYRYTAMAVNEVDVCRIPLSTVINLQVEYPEYCDQINRHLQNHLDRADEWIIALSAGSARHRVILLLLMFDELARDTSDGVKLLGR
jgi:hypothetical protein